MNAPPFDPRSLLAQSRLGVLATIKSDGYPQLSPVMPFYDQGVGVIYVAMSDRSAKTANLRRDPRAALEVTGPDGGAWATAEGTVTLTGPGTDPHGPEVEALARGLLPHRRRGAPGLGRLPIGDGDQPQGPHDDGRGPRLRCPPPLTTRHGSPPDAAASLRTGPRVSISPIKL
jgi:PPOX class probable F420-dependent enzyme